MKGFDAKSIAGLGRMGLAAMNRNLPSILTGAAIAGLLATVWATYCAATDVKSALENAKWDKACKTNPEINEDDDDEIETESENDTEKSTDDVKLTVWETVTAVAPYVWKPALCGTFTAGCVIGAQVLNMQRLTMLAGAYKLSEKKLKEYEEKAKEILGEKKATELHDETVKAMTPQEFPAESMIPHTGKGEQLCYDIFSGRYFYGSTEAIRCAEATLLKALVNGDWVNLNELYYELGLEQTKYGDKFGWANKTIRSKPIDIRLTYDAREINGEVKVVCILDYTDSLDDEYFMHMAR